MLLWPPLPSDLLHGSLPSAGLPAVALCGAVPCAAASTAAAASHARHLTLGCLSGTNPALRPFVSGFPAQQDPEYVSDMLRRNIRVRGMPWNTTEDLQRMMDVVRVGVFHSTFPLRGWGVGGGGVQHEG